MELRTDIPSLFGNFHYFHKIGSRVHPYPFHARLLKLLEVAVVELIAVTVTFLDQHLLTICLPRTTVFHEFALIGTQSHRTAHLRDALLLFHEVDNVVWCVFIHLTTVGILITQHVSGKLNDHHLHAQADTEGGDIMCPGIFGCDNLTFNTPCAEARADHNAVHAAELFGYILLGEMLTVDEVRLHLSVIIGAGMCQTLQNTLIRILEVVLTNKTDVDDLR